jgi:hypothetical protein
MFSTEESHNYREALGICKMVGYEMLGEARETQMPAIVE